MALIKSYNTPKGIASYWIAGVVQADNYNKTAYGRLYGFASKEHCDMEGSVPVTILDYSVTPDFYDTYFHKDIMVLAGVTHLTQFYKLVKENNYMDEQGNILTFADAVDEY